MRPSPPEFRRQIVGLVRWGRSVEELAREFEPSAGAIRNWVKQADLDEGRRSDALTTDEQEELRQLRRENKRLKVEQEILKKAAAWLARGEQLDPGAGFEFVKQHQADYPVRVLGRTSLIRP